MTTKTNPNVAEEYAETVAQSLKEVEHLLKGGDFEAVSNWLDELLELKVTTTHTLGTTTETIDEVCATVTIGGPNAFVVFNRAARSASVNVHWGGEHATRHVHIPRLTNWVLNHVADFLDMNN